MASLKILKIVFSLLLLSNSIASISSLQKNSGSGFHGGRHRESIDSPAVQLQFQDQYVVMDNGILQVNFSNPGGMITGIKYNGIDNLLAVLNDESNRGYWDVVWNGTGVTRKKGNFVRIVGTRLNVTVQTEDKIELSFTTMWDPSLEGITVPLNVDRRFVMLRGSSGFYTYAIYEHLKEWPAFDLDNTRVAFKLRKDKFHYMSISDSRQRYMPLPDDREKGRGQALEYPEAVLLVDPIEPEFKGEVDDKYQYSCESKDIEVHGWISSDPPTGFWQITPSNEFRSGGPLKQCLTSHVGPTSLSVFVSTHYAGADMIMRFGLNEEWKKVYGPVFVYLNSLPAGDPLSLWGDAKKQMIFEAQAWPYDFLASEDFPRSDRRGTVRGRLIVQDKFGSNMNVPASDAYVGLAAPGDAGSWQLESKGYQFWTKTDKDGLFIIRNVRTGDYNIYAWVSGHIGEYRSDSVIKITPGSVIDVADLVYEPPRDGPTLWEIGYPDRTAAEFYVPDANPMYINRLYVNQERYRQYGLWERYSELYPDGDLNFTIGTSNYTKDWFFAQVTRKTGNNTYAGTTWQIRFTLAEINQTGTYKLRLALATANAAMLQVRVNILDANPLFATGTLGRDNTIARHGIHGLYRLFNIDVPGAQLQSGTNVIFLTQASSFSPFQGIMYDYIRFEGPSPGKIKKI